MQRPAVAFLTVVLPLLVSQSMTSAGTGRLDKCAQLGEILDRLSRLVDFYSTDPDRVNADGYFGLRLSHDLLVSERIQRALLQHSTVTCGSGGSRLPSLLRAIVQKQGLLLDRFEATVGDKSRYDRRTFGRICLPLGTRLRRLFADGELQWRRVHQPWQQQRHLASDGIVDKAEQFIDYNELRGDACLLAGLQRKRCSAVAGKCEYFDRPLETSSGYYLTHQLLYRLSEHLNTCPVSAIEGGYITVPAEMVAMCKKAFDEFRLIQAANWTHISQSILTENMISVLQDLYIEQAVLCGLIRIEDFYHKSAMDTVASWQDPELGCYKMYQKDSTIVNDQASLSYSTGRRILRDVEMLGGCSAHSSGLAMTYYSNAIRYLLGT